MEDPVVGVDIIMSGHRIPLGIAPGGIFPQVKGVDQTIIGAEKSPVEDVILVASGERSAERSSVIPSRSTVSPFEMN